MKPIKFDKFAGLLPRSPEQLLPEIAATDAKDCDFTYSELRSLRSDYLLRQLSNSAISVFSEDGLRFFSWDSDTDAVLSPVANGDAAGLLYFTNGTEFRMCARSAASTSGGAPGTSYKVGVPRPTAAPAILIANTTAIDLENITPTGTFHYEYNGIKYQEQAISLSTVEAGKKYAFKAPERRVSAKAGEERAARMRDLKYDPMSEELKDPTPVNAFAVIRLTFKKDLMGPPEPGKANGEIKLDQYSSNSRFVKDDNLAVTLTQANTNSLDYSVSVESKYSAKDSEARTYVYTYANIYNEESAPSPPTTVNVQPDSSIVLTCTAAQLAGYAPLKEIRVYRTQKGGFSDDLYFAFSIPAGSLTQKDTVKALGLNEPLKSWHYLPPNPALKGLMNVGNGILAAWVGNQLHFSEAYKPWAWPPEYVKTFAFNVVGAIVHGAGVFVTTVGNPYLVYGVAPDSMTQEKLNVEQAGVSKFAMASIEGRLIYASHDGLVTITGGRASLSDSEMFFTREIWRAKYANGLSSMQFAEYDGALIVFSRAGSFTPFSIRFDESRGAMSEISNFQPASAFYLVTSDGLYYTKSGTLYQFAVGDYKRCRWRSKEIVQDKPNCYSVANAWCKGEFSIEFWADGVLRHTESIIDQERTFRLPAGYRASHWQIVVEGKGQFKRLRIANSGRQLGEM